MTIPLTAALDRLGSCYKTIEVKILAFKKGDSFTNITARILFSMDEATEERQSEEHNNLHLFTMRFPFTKWDAIRNELEEGIFRVGKDIVITHNKLKVENLSIDHVASKCAPWPELAFESYSKMAVDISEVERGVKGFGYPHLASLRNYRFGHYWGPHNEEIIKIVAPIYAKIESVKLSKDGVPEAVVSAHGELCPLNLTMELLGRNNMPLCESVHRELQHDQEAISELDITLEKIDITKEEASLKISLIQPDIGEEINYSYRGIEELILENGLTPAPLMAALDLFMNKKELIACLENPETSRMHGKKARSQDVFEETVSKVLALFGFPSVHLGAYEVLNEKDSAKNSGSADVLSYDGKTGTLFVISCKSGITDKNAVDQILNTANKVMSRINNDILNVLPTIFTSTEAVLIKEEASKFGVLVIDMLLMRRLLDVAQIREVTLDDMDLGGGGRVYQ